LARYLALVINVCSEAKIAARSYRAVRIEKVYVMRVPCADRVFIRSDHLSQVIYIGVNETAPVATKMELGAKIGHSTVLPNHGTPSNSWEATTS